MKIKYSSLKCSQVNLNPNNTQYHKKNGNSAIGNPPPEKITTNKNWEILENLRLQKSISEKKQAMKMLNQGPILSESDEGRRLLMGLDSESVCRSSELVYNFKKNQVKR